MESKNAEVKTATMESIEITAPMGYSLAKELGKDEMKQLMKRAMCEVEYANKTENPARTLTLSSQLRRFVCAVLVKMPSRKASFIIGKEKPVIVSAENLEADYLSFSKAFESASKITPMWELSYKLFVREDGTTFRRAYVKLASDAPFYAKEIA